MCSYTHSGAGQIGYRASPKRMCKPSYTGEAKVQVLNLTNMALLFLTRMFFMSTGHQPEAAETRTVLLPYSTEFEERLKKTVSSE